MRTSRSWWLTLPVHPGSEPVLVGAECGTDRGELTTDHAAYLTDAERLRCATMGPRRAAEFARGRALLRRLAVVALGVPAKHLEIEVGPTGRPRLTRHQAGVSISHTATYTAAALWRRGDVGIDVEEPPLRLDPRLVRRCCHGAAAVVVDLPHRRRAAAFARVWSVQEACVKSLGQGLSGRPWRIPVDPTAERGRWGSVHWFASNALAPVALAVAVRMGGPPVRCGESEEGT